MEKAQMQGEEPNEVEMVVLGGAGGVSWCECGA